MPGQESAHVMMQSRIRDNQRRSRARQKEYIHELEEKVQACERLGVQASLEIQQAARNVLEENKRLRALLLSRDLGDGGLAGGGGGVAILTLSSEAIYLQEKLERHGSSPREVGREKEVIGQHTEKGQQMPPPPLQRNMSKPAPSSSALPSPIVACCGGGAGGSSSKCAVPMSPANTGDVEMRETISEEGKVARVLPPPYSAPSPQEAPLSATSPREVLNPPEAQPRSNARPKEMSLPLLQTPMLAPSGCCGPSKTCAPPLQSPDVVMASLPRLHETEPSAPDHTESLDGAMLALSSSSGPDLRTELDPETDTSSCAFAVSIIAGMRCSMDPEDIKQALGCRGDNLNECTIENSRLFAAVDQFAE